MKNKFIWINWNSYRSISNYWREWLIDWLLVKMKVSVYVNSSFVNIGYIKFVSFIIDKS